MSNFYAAPSHMTGGFTIYSGSRRQRGGFLLGSLSKLLIPAGKALAKRIGAKAAEMAANTALNLTIKKIKKPFMRKKSKPASSQKRKLKQNKTTAPPPPSKRRRTTPSQATLNRRQLF